MWWLAASSQKPPASRSQVLRLVPRSRVLIGRATNVSSPRRLGAGWARGVGIWRRRLDEEDPMWQLAARSRRRNEKVGTGRIGWMKSAIAYVVRNHRPCEIGWDGIERAPMLDRQHFHRSSDATRRWNGRGLAIFSLDDASGSKNDEPGRKSR